VYQVVEERSLTLPTVEGHLEEAIQAGESVELSRLVTADKQAAIEAAIQELGPAPLKPIMERLGRGFTYGEIRWVRATMSHEGRLPSGGGE
jgi:hypothetical protein